MRTTVATTDGLEIHLFGGFSVRYGGEQLPPLPSRPARSLFALLALHAGRPQPRTLLADRFWPEIEEARARRKLSHALWQLQDALGELAPGHTYLRTPGDTVVFDATGPYWLDVEEFERRLDRVDRAEVLDGAALRELRTCVELYRGDLLAGGYDMWALDEQLRLEQRYVAALSRLIEGCKQRGNFDEALSLARRLTHQNPLREDAHREVMRLCVLLGRPGEAMEQYERCRSVFLEELGTEPAAETTQLYARVARTREVTAPRRTPVEELVSRRLVGRDDERVTLVDQLERTLGGQPGIVFVEGEPGIGKTQLLTQAAADASWRGFQVLWGSCRDDGVAYGAVARALRASLTPVTVAQLRARVAPVWLDAASALLPALTLPGASQRSRVAAPGGSAEEGAERVREALTQVVSALAAIDPVFLVIEDAHHADPESLELLRRASQRRHAGRLLVALSFRDVEARADERVWAGLREVDRDTRPLRLQLRALTPFETSSLVAEVLGTAQVPTAFVRSIHRESGGNPLYAVELLRALRDTGRLSAEDRDRLETLSIPVTEDLRSVIERRLTHLVDDARAVVEVAAVLGEECPEDALERASGLDELGLSAALGEAVRRNVLATDGHLCRFTHAAMRRVVLDALPEGRLRDLHAAAATALEATHPERIEALATHLRLAGQPRRALPYLRQAAQRAQELHAYATAADHLRAAVALLDSGPAAPGQRHACLLELEEALGVLGERDEQDTVLTQLEAAVGGDVGDRIEVALRRATYLGHVDDFEAAREVAEHAVTLASGDAREHRGRALTVLGRVLSWSGDNDRAAGVLAEAAELLRDEPTAEAEARFGLGTALRFVQRFDAAHEAFARSLDLAEERDDIRQVVQALGGLADLQAEASRTSEAVAAYERAIELARSIGYRHREGVSLVNLGTVRLLRAEPAASSEAFDRAHQVFDELGNRRGVATVRMNRSWLLHRWLGRDDEAERDARAAHEYFRSVGNLGSAAVCLETLAAIDRRRGRSSAATAALEDALGAAGEAGERRAEIQIRRGTVELALELGDVAAASSQLDIAEAVSRQLELDEFTAELRSLRASVLARAGREEDALAVADEALAHLDTSSEPHRILHRVAQVAQECGDPQGHDAHALAAFERLDRSLQGLTDRERELAVDRVPAHRAIVEAGQRLSPQEIEVRLARADAPRGRALDRDETVLVHLDLGPPPTTPEERTATLLTVLEQVERAGAEVTLDDLASILDVSLSTVRRDLRAVRAQGHDARTRGSRAG